MISNDQGSLPEKEVKVVIKELIINLILISGEHFNFSFCFSLQKHCSNLFNNFIVKKVVLNLQNILGTGYILGVSLYD